jgi:hypothetical protein
MDKPIADLPELLRGLSPALHGAVFVFATLPPGTDPSSVAALATFHEAEGITVIVEEPEARRANLPVLFRSAWITLTVRSDLQAVGLTAAVATALAAANISCNVVAAVHHDHLFVPIADADAAMDVLRALQRDAAAQARRA